MEAKTRQKYYSGDLQKNQQLVLQSNLSNVDTEGVRIKDVNTMTSLLRLHLQF